MGCGKSSVGRRVASLTGHRFVDSDELAAQKAGKPIPEIFAEFGEAAFREIERDVIADLVGVAGIVLATGGGAVLREQNRETLRRIGTVVWLDAEPDVLFERAIRSQRRPLLQTANPRATFDELLAARLAIYREATDVRIDSTGLGHDEVAKRVLDSVMRHRAAEESARGGT